MNSGELKVDVPLASMESDCEEIVDSVANTPSRKVGNNGGGQSGLAPPKILDGGDSLTGSLEDLVNSFDEKLTMCFQDYQEQVDKIAPVQVSIQHKCFSFLYLELIYYCHNTYSLLSVRRGNTSVINAFSF